MGKSLRECPQCGSIEFCVEEDRESGVEWVVCRQCDKTYGEVKQE